MLTWAEAVTQLAFQVAELRIELANVTVDRNQQATEVVRLTAELKELRSTRKKK